MGAALSVALWLGERDTVDVEHSLCCQEGVMESVALQLGVREAEAGALPVALWLGEGDAVEVEHSLASGEGVAEAVVEGEGSVLGDDSALAV